MFKEKKAKGLEPKTTYKNTDKFFLPLIIIWSNNCNPLIIHQNQIKMLISI